MSCRVRGPMAENHDDAISYWNDRNLDIKENDRYHRKQAELPTNVFRSVEFE